MYYHIFILILMLLNIVFFQSKVQAKHHTPFAIDLIHKDSLQSPLYNKSLSQSQLLANIVHRSHARVSSYMNEKQTGILSLESNGIDYLTRYYLQDVEVVAFVDPTTSFMWTEKEASMNYASVPALSTQCSFFSDFTKAELGGDCFYEFKGNDKGLYKSYGVICFDFFSFKSGMEQNYILYGLSNRNEDLGSPVKGIIGLGRDPISFVQQLGINKFTYCMHPIKRKKSTHIWFGDLPSTSISTSSPLQNDPFPNGSSYYLNLESISIAIGDTNDRVNIGVTNDRVKISEQPHLIKIDFGTSMTYLKRNTYVQVEEKLKRIIGMNPIREEVEPFKLCYESNDQTQNHLPKMEFHFTQGTIKLPPSNVFITYREKLCLSLFAIDDPMPSIFGSLAQSHHVMTFDLENKLISFHSQDCKIWDTTYLP